MRCRRKKPTFGIVLVVLGALIILAVLLPHVFWWLILGALLVVLGISIIRK